MSAKPPFGGSTTQNGCILPLTGARNGVSLDHDWQRSSQIAVVGLFVVALLWCAYVAQHVIVPVLLAWTIATIVLPGVKWMEGFGIPRAVAAIGVAVLLLALILVLVLLLSAPLTYWLGRATYIGALLREKLASFSQPLTFLQELQKGLNAIGSGNPGALKVEPQTSSIVTTILAVVTPAISGFVIFVFSLIFYLIYRPRLRNAIVMLVSDRESRLTVVRTLNDIDEHMTTYFGTFTLINVGLGVAATALTWAIGLPNPLLWGVLATLLNYIPYLGPAVVIGTLAVVGLLYYSTLKEAAVAPILYLGLVTIEGQFITPTLMGRRLEINPFAVFLAIAFCTWFWGPVGAFLAVPLLMALSVILQNTFQEEKPDLPQ
jgi:predicted PurR-regulated permease PerM